MIIRMNTAANISLSMFIRQRFYAHFSFTTTFLRVNTKCQAKIVCKSFYDKLKKLFMRTKFTLQNLCNKNVTFILSTRGYQKVLSLTWKEPEIWIYSALFFNVVPFQLHTLVPSSYPVINTRSVEVNILVP